jgi:hypothetical protein
MRVLRIGLGLLVLAGGLWFTRGFWSGQEHAIRSRLKELARLASVQPNQSLVSKALALDKMRDYFASDVVVHVTLDDGEIVSVEGRAELLDLAKRLHTSVRQFEVQFTDLTVGLSGDKQSARVDLTMRYRAEDTQEESAEELRMDIRKRGRTWQIVGVENVQVLRR